MSFQFTGFADEAEKSLDGQIETLKEAGWSAIELRLLDGANVCDQTDEQWNHTWEKLQKEGIRVVGFGGQIGNWARPITSEFQVDIDELKRVAPRMREAGTKFLRIMSYPNPDENPLSKEDWKAETVRRLKELSTIAEGEGVVLAHENCSGYGAFAEGYLELVEAVDSPALQLILDSGNNSLHENTNEATWDFYEACKKEITHVHIKSAKSSGSMSKCQAHFPACYGHILVSRTLRLDVWNSIIFSQRPANQPRRDIVFILRVNIIRLAYINDNRFPRIRQ